MRRAMAVFLLLWQTSCAALLHRTTDPPVYDRQEEAQTLIWEGVLGRKEPHPWVFWVEGRHLTCTTPGGKQGFGASFVPGCLAGVTYVPWAITVARRPGEKYSEGAFAHEHLHAAQGYDGISDPNHILPDWQPGGLLEVMNKELAKAGM